LGKPRTPLTLLSRTVLTQLKVCGAKAQEKMRECMDLEFEEPTTSNEHYLADYKEKFIARYRAARRVQGQMNSPLQKFVNGGFQNTNYMQVALQNLRAMGLDAPDHKSLLRLIPPDSAEHGIEIMAEVRAYYQGERASNRANASDSHQSLSSDLPIISR
jgi:hypothetical protein